MTMSGIHLAGQLVCRDDVEATRVAAHLPRHIELTRAEAGCVSFEVQPTSDPLVWSVEERFTDSAAFAAHQARVAQSAWGIATAGIERRSEVTGL